MRNEIVKKMDINEYHKPEHGLSNTSMKFLLDCPARYHAEYLDPAKPKPEKKDHFEIGKALHSLLLEPDTFWQSTAVMPKADGRTTEGKKIKAAALAMAGNKTLIDEEQYVQVKAMRDSLIKRIPWLTDVLKTASIEESFFWQDEETGVQLKNRPDIYTQDFWIDVKTTSNLNMDAYARSIITYGYHRQAALAREALLNLKGIKYSHFMHVIVEESWPYLTDCYILDDGYLEKGDAEFRQAARTYKQCLDTNEWPDYGHQVKQIYLPSWVK